MADKQIQILEAEEYHRPDFEQMVGIIWDLLMKYGRTISKIYIDAANPSLIKNLKLRMGEPDDYDEIIADCRKSGRDYEYDMTVVPVSFGVEGRSLLSNCKMLMERDGRYVAINKKFSKLITSLRTASEKGEFQLDKELTLHDDIFDAFRLCMRFFYFRDKTEAYRRYANVDSFQMGKRFS